MIISDINLRNKFVLDIGFFQNHRQHLYASYSGTKRYINQLYFLQNPKNSILQKFLGFFPQIRIF